MPGQPVAVGAPPPERWAYQRAPMIVDWQLNLPGVLPGRAGDDRIADPRPAPAAELDTAEGMALLDAIARFGEPLPHLVMSGGDPLSRPDLRELVRAAVERGIGVSLVPVLTPQLTRHRLAELAADGVEAITLRLDASSAQRHDGLHGKPGLFDETLTALAWAAELGLSAKVDTLVSAGNTLDLPAVYDLLRGRAVTRWSLLFPVSAQLDDTVAQVTAGEAERLVTWLARLDREAPFQVRTTEAMHYRRVAARCLARKGLTRAQIEAHPSARGFGIREGNGTVFVAYDGTITPSGLLLVPLGCVRRDHLVEVYRDHPTMRALRDPAGFVGRCGVCDYHDWCGGSRARAYAWTGDPLESDPLCAYVPGRYAATLATPMALVSRPLNGPGIQP